MTPDLQETLSKKYVAAMVIGLGSGRIALLGADRQLLAYYDNPHELFQAIHEYAPPAEVLRQERPTSAKKLTVTLTLEDLDLG